MQAMTKMPGTEIMTSLAHTSISSLLGAKASLSIFRLVHDGDSTQEQRILRGMVYIFLA